MSQENTPRNNNRTQRRNNQSNPPTPEGTFNLGNTPPSNPQLNLRPQSLYYNQPYPNLPCRNPYLQQPSFNQFSSQHQQNAFNQIYVFEFKVYVFNCVSIKKKVRVKVKKHICCADVYVEKICSLPSSLKVPW